MFKPPFLRVATARSAAPGAALQRVDAARALALAPWLALWLLAWLVWTGLTSQSPPVDNAEQLSWVRSLEWGYYKHPPLPTALLWPLVRMFGIHEWVSYAAAGVVNGLSLLLLHSLVTRLMGPRLALMALLGTLCVGYYSLRLAYFNHDTVLMLAHLAVAACAWQVWAAPGPQAARRAWWGLGLALGLGGLAKYQVSLSAGAVFVFWVLNQGWRDPLHRRGLLEAGVLALLVMSPHLAWLVNHNFQPFDYARSNALAGKLSRAQCSVDALRWVGDQFSQLAGPLLLGLGLQLGFARPVRHWGPAARLALAPTAADTPARADVSRPGTGAFLFCFGLLPLICMPAMAVAMSAKLHMNWGSAFMPLTCAALMQVGGTGRWRRLPLRQVLLGFVLVQAVLAAWAWRQHAVPRPVFTQQRSAQFDSQQVADAIAAPARALLGGPVTVIAGRQRLVSVLALRLPERPLVLVDGRPELSPWLPEDLSTLCAVLWVGDATDRPPADLDVHAVPRAQGLWWAVDVLSERADRCPVVPSQRQPMVRPGAGVPTDVWYQD